MNLEREKEAYLLFGGIASGKTTLAGLFEAEGNCEIISQDKSWYKKDMEVRDLGLTYNRKHHLSRVIQKIQTNTASKLVIDDNIKRPNPFNPYIIDLIKETHRSITAVYFNLSEKTRKKRFQTRLSLQNQIKERLSEILQRKLSNSTIELSRIFRDKEIYNQIPASLKPEYDLLVQQLYLSGACFFDESKPNLNNFPGLDYVIEFKDEDCFNAQTIQQLNVQKIPIQRYQNERAGKPIKLCVWDVGNVLYQYHYYALAHFLNSQSKLDYPFSNFKNKYQKIINPFMCGAIDFNQFAKSFCELFEIKPSPSNLQKLEEALKKGISKQIEISHQTIKNFQAKGIQNAILSNAIPLLANGIKTQNHIIPKELQFLSYQTGVLKPDPQAWQQVLEKTGIAPEDTLFIDDTKVNIITSIRLGIAGILFNAQTFQAQLNYQLPNTFSSYD